jgi:formamidopyrimidine-DNA glycosylase
MPELPEVETTLRGIEPYLLNKKITEVIIRSPRLRWPIPKTLPELLCGQTILELSRRGKYILITMAKGHLILHLGMSGRISVLTETTPAQKHDHVDLIFANQLCLRFTDPRRFGAFLFTPDNPLQHPLLRTMGPEPLTPAFNGNYLWRASRNKQVAVKIFIMNSKIVAGVGNIYATEALYQAQIHPEAPARSINLAQYTLLAKAIKTILRYAIKQGGTTLKDFINPAGKPGYFRLKLKAYGRAGEKCKRCPTLLCAVSVGQRTTVYCTQCQPLPHTK